MQEDMVAVKPAWPLWRKLIFRFFFIFFCLQLLAWTWLGLPFTEFYDLFIEKMVTLANEKFFHIRKELVPANGSGDTSFAWAELNLYLWVSTAGSLIWSIVDYRRGQYDRLDYWLRIFLRYYIINISVIYGSSKLFMQQMPYPSLSFMATPVGELSGMRLSWIFLGYGTKYQMFAGIMELAVAVLLLYRRTIVLGLMLGVAVYFNVFMLNLSYDIPVKLFSLQLTFYCIYLLAYDAKRLFAFFLKDTVIPARNPFRPPIKSDTKRVFEMVAKCFFLLYLGIHIARELNVYDDETTAKNTAPFQGLYDVTLFTINKDTISPNHHRYWKDIAFEKEGYGSVNTGDSAFIHRYGRGYFGYNADTAKHIVHLTNKYADDLPPEICDLHYAAGTGDRIKLWSVLHSDSLYIEIAPRKKPFRLAENRFHWLSEQVP